jgi:FAD/FMN-containing dehydrogenase
MSAQMITPHDSEYETARLAWNLAADQRPDVVCVARSVDEVQGAILHARENGLRIATQSTGHGAGPLPPLENTMLLKTKLDSGDVAVDPASGSVSFRSGVTWRDVVSEVSARGLTVMHGSSPSVSPVGYLLAGGLSFYAREHGLATNHVTRFELVTVDGEVRTASREENPELFWGLRGGGGIFGAVTGIEIGTLPVSETFAGTSFWPAESAPEILETWRTWTREAPDSVTSTFRILRLPPVEEVPEPIRGLPVACVDGVALDHEAGSELAARLERHGPPLLGGWGVQPSLNVATLHGDPEDPLPGMGDSIVLEELTDDAAAAFVDAAGAESGSELVVAELRHLGGALSRPADGAGVLSHIEGEFLLFGTGIAAPDSAAKTSADLDRLIETMSDAEGPHKFSSFAERDCSLSDCFGPDEIDALRKLRDTYDPDGLFIVPQPLD